MASSAHSVNFEGIPLNRLSGVHSSSSEDDFSQSVNLRRTQTDVHLRERRRHDPDKYHSYGGRECRAQYSLPSRSGGELLSSHVFHHGRECRPSAWYNTVMARRRKGQGPNTEDEVVDEIAEAMVGDEKLMSSNVDGEIMRREAMRDLIKPLRVKKEIRRRLTERRSSHRHGFLLPISRLQGLKYSISMHWYKVKQTVLDTFHDYSLWHKDLKKIEGTFGTGVGSYFRFLRYLFLLNLAIALLVCGFLLTPQLLARKHLKEPSGGGGLTLSTTPAAIAITPASLIVDDWAASANLPEATWSPVTLEATDTDTDTPCNNSVIGKAFGGLDWLTGAGWFEATELYYGTYSSGSISVSAHHHYSMPKAYFLVMFVLFIVYLVVILHRVVVLYKNNDIDIEHDMSASFVRKVFSSWDFSITEKKAADIKHKSIYNELKEILQEYLSEEQELEWHERARGWLVKVGLWTLVLAFLALLGWATYAMLHLDVLRNTRSSLGLLVYPLIVTCIILVIPLVFTQVVRVEGYTAPRTRLYVTLVRTILLELTVLGVLVGTWYTQATSVFAPETEDPTTETDTEGEEPDECWETSLGQEFYRLLIMDFIVGLVMHLVTFIISTVSHRTAMEFNVSRYAVHLIYNQTLLWAGLFFCPLTPLIVVIKIIIMFYIQKFILLHCLKPDDNPWRAAQAETVYLVLTLVSLMLSFFGYMFILLKGKTSCGCGPFRGFTNYVNYFWTIMENDQEVVLRIVAWLFKPGVVAGILIVMVILVYCAKSTAEGRAEMIKVLRHQLELELRDRAFLLKLTERVRKGNYRPARPTSHHAASPPAQTPREPHGLTQRASSFVFTDSKVYPTDSAPTPHRFSDYTEQQSMTPNSLTNTEAH
ncbi:Transmembrane channel-like protein 7 [Chionoecetes opilio]|uniref:Transmembrane channel-like protein 7 n=1 Tax=Chionoecetes opilio TaxID=41210 RepID=A0A8J4Y563_CHIOP|nr:Transmembrane channel-like protein 7 [Chionoecetes opilio]